MGTQHVSIISHPPYSPLTLPYSPLTHSFRGAGAGRHTSTSAAAPRTCRRTAAHTPHTLPRPTLSTPHAQVVGVSFHVGSGAKNLSTYGGAITSAKHIFDLAELMGFHMELLDIGGVNPGVGCFGGVNLGVGHASA